MNYTFRTEDHPEANGRQPIPGDVAHTVTFPLEDGGRLRVHIGPVGLEALRDLIRQHDADYPPDACEHGVKPGEWCEPCNKEYKRAADADENA